MAGLLCLHAFQMSMIVLNYEYNQEVFVRLFCENQDKPELHCNGQCFLKDSIDQAKQDQNTNNNEQEIKLTWSQFCPQNEEITHFSHQGNDLYTFSPYLVQAHLLLLPTGVFHPPQA